MGKKKKDESPAVQRSAADEEAREEAIALMKEAQSRAAKNAKKKGNSETEEDAKDEKDPDKTKPKKFKKKKKVFDENGVPMLGQVKVYSPFRTYFDGPAYSVSALNGTGVFDVLPGHKSFLSLLLPYEVVIHGKKGEDRLKIERGIMHVADDELIIFLDV